MVYNISYFGISHKGLHRDNNEDCFACDQSPILFSTTYGCKYCEGSFSNKEHGILGVFDGIGGLPCGEVASSLAATEINNMCINRDIYYSIEKYYTRVSSLIREYTIKHGIREMGTTAAFLAFADNKIVLSNIGDSKIFLHAKGRLKQISKDFIMSSAVGNNPIVTQYVGLKQDYITPFVSESAYYENDRYIICSDGLTDMVSLESINNVMKSDFANEQCVTTLLRMALHNGGYDNISIIICSIEKKKTLNHFTVNKKGIIQ